MGRLGLAVAGLFLCGASSLPADSLGSFQHVAYVKKDGAPADVSNIVQGPDGFLWINGTKGATRFDGASFTPLTLAAGNRFQHAQLLEVYPARDGGLWVSDGSGGPVLVTDGHLTSFGPAQGFTGASGRFFDGPGGSIWACGDDGIFLFDPAAGRWIRRIPAPASSTVNQAAFDVDGNLWASMAAGPPMVVPKGEDRLRPIQGGPDRSLLVFIGRSGRIYLTSSTMVRVYRREGTSLVETMKPLEFGSYFVLEDTRGNVWVSSPRSGAVFVSREAMEDAERSHGLPAFESLKQSDGLSGAIPWPILEDRAGNIWFGTGSGVDRFTRTAFTRVGLPAGMSEVSVAVRRDGEVWIGGLMQAASRGRPPAAFRETMVSKNVFAMSQDTRTDTTWLANPDGLWSVDDAGVRRVAPMPAEAFVGNPPCVASDGKGRVYVCHLSPKTGPYRWDGARWEALLPDEKPRVMAVDRDDAIWMGTGKQKSLLRLTGEKLQTWTAKDGLRTSPVKAILPVAGGVWLGGENGIQFFDGKRFITVQGGDGETFKPTTGLALDGHGNLWVHTLLGVARIERASLAAAMGDRGRTMAFHLFGDDDGLSGAPDPDRTLPTLRPGPDGRIWAQMQTSLAWIDPDRLPVASAPPRPVIESLLTEAGPRRVKGERIDLSGGERSLSIGYTAPALAEGGKVHFRYRLAGFADAWQDVGTRREAVFTNVPPGDYVFDVMAVGASGLASPVTSLAMTRHPSTVESWWFRSLAVLPLLGLVWLAHYLRTRSLRRKMQIRIDEREAVARDIHDTLLQRFHGVMLSLQAWAADDAIPERRRAEISDMSGQARDALLEGRERILSLRGAGDDGLALYDQIAAEGSLLQQRFRLAFVLDAKGKPRPLRDECSREILHIAFEAMRNAFGHSGGETVRVVLNYADDALWLSVLDDGRGMPGAEAGVQDGTHFGLVGLSERVRRAGGVLHVDTAPDEGTEVHVKIPARNAYARGSARERA
ncbi:sensor histidine kinase [Luteibacter sp. UNCMF331Sha3.1]|uniref:sensor histidine kinase n=1 Tax=Luteibacter sp. UNCMF331Sha3.1 TaxID=1502760 RepID=UPI00147CFA96|nr:sensor histidine kinase [Luteibacter sp. UNCMF331Sha3.1]